MKSDLWTAGLEDCGCCQTPEAGRDWHGAVYGCHERSTVFTSREEEILKRIRDLSLKAKEVKKQLACLGSGQIVDEAAKTALKEELASLRQRRAALESERVAAAEERMRLLGHI